MVDLSKNLKTELYKIERLSNRATVFLSYARADSPIAKQIEYKLKIHDYRVWSEMDMESGTNWQSEIFRGIDEASKYGFVLLLISSASLQSTFSQAEMRYAFHHVDQNPRSNIVPVLVEPLKSDSISKITSLFSNLQYFDLTKGNFDQRIEELISNLKTREMEK